MDEVIDGVPSGTIEVNENGFVVPLVFGYCLIVPDIEVLKTNISTQTLLLDNAAKNSYKIGGSKCITCGVRNDSIERVG
jgi:hypothetical protein